MSNNIIHSYRQHNQYHTLTIPDFSLLYPRTRTILWNNLNYVHEYTRISSNDSRINDTISNLDKITRNLYKKRIKENFFDIKSLNKYYYDNNSIKSYIDPDNVINISEKMKENITCSICFGVFNDPQILECNHRFCNSCINKTRKRSCPLCRKNIDYYSNKADDKLQKIINSFNINCEKCNKTHNISVNCKDSVLCIFCNKQVLKKKFLSHLKKKCNIIIKCDKCNKYEFKHLIDLHKKEICIMRHIKCTYCNKIFLFKNLNEHMKLCGDRITKICTICSKEYKIKNKESHYFLCKMKMEERKEKQKTRQKTKEKKLKYRYKYNNNNCKIK